MAESVESAPTPRYNRKAPLCTTSQETAWLFHEIGNCFLMMRIFEYALESGMKALRAASEGNNRRLQLQACVLFGVSEVNLGKYREAYSHFEEALDHAKILALAVILVLMYPWASVEMRAAGGGRRAGGVSCGRQAKFV